MNRIKLVDVEWSEGVPDVDGVTGYDAVRLLVRFHGRPIGEFTVPVVEGILSGKALRRAIVARFGPDLERRQEVQPVRSENPDPKVTVAVCTRDNPRDLERCLSALSELTYPHVELMVVDNAPSTDETGELVRSTFPGVEYRCETRPGLNWARNRAIDESRAEILAYTDDDVVVDPGWVDALVAALQDSEVMAVTGLVVPLELETAAQIHFELYGGFGCGFERRAYSWVKGSPPAHRGQMMECGTGANMAFRREVFDRVGRFDPALDVGTATAGGGDVEMFFRVLKEGFTLVYEPEALVRHRHRREAAALRTQIWSWGTGSVAVLARSARAYPDERWRMIRLGVRGMGRQLRRLLESLVRPPGFPRALLFAELEGAVAGLWRYRTAIRAAEELTRSSEGREDDLADDS